MKNLLYSLTIAFTLLLTGCADAGEDQRVVVAGLVQLDGSESTPDWGGEIIKYHWK